jgi:hypothetical protein
MKRPSDRLITSNRLIFTMCSTSSVASVYMSLKCRETLSVACWSSEECKFTWIFSCLSLINLHFHFECCRSLKSWFHGKMVSPAGRISLWGHESELLDLRFLWHWLKGKIFWVVVACSSEGTQHFRGAYHLHLHGWRVNWAKSHQNISFLPASAGFLLGFLFDPECADDIFFCKAVLSPNYTMCYNPEGCSLHGSGCFTSEPAANCHTVFLSCSVWMNWDSVVLQ